MRWDDVNNWGVTRRRTDLYQCLLVFLITVKGKEKPEILNLSHIWEIINLNY